MLYKIKVKFLKTPMGNWIWRMYKTKKGEKVGEFELIPKFINKYAPGKSFVDIGCMWGIDGEFSFIAEKNGAKIVKGVDVYGPTEEFIRKKNQNNSSVEFILGDVTNPIILKQIGLIDIVLCAGVLYHHPSPFDLLVALRKMCNEILILRTSTIPENKSLLNSAVYFPGLSDEDRKLWNLKSLGVGFQAGITEMFNAEEGYGNWFWGLSPSSLVSLLETAGFTVLERYTEAFAQTVICKPSNINFSYELQIRS
jgi:hypothetical protein